MSTESQMTPAPLSMTVRSDDRGLYVTALGEIDMSTSGKFRDCLTVALEQRPETLVVDLAGVKFLDSTGIAALVFAHNRATEDPSQPTALTVINCQPMVRRVLEVTGLLPVLTDDDGPPQQPANP
jgi:anti-anti-sigma factor